MTVCCLPYLSVVIETQRFCYTYVYFYPALVFSDVRIELMTDMPYHFPNVTAFMSIPVEKSLNDYYHFRSTQFPALSGTGNVSYSLRAYGRKAYCG